MIRIIAEEPIIVEMDGIWEDRPQRDCETVVRLFLRAMQSQGI